MNNTQLTQDNSSPAFLKACYTTLKETMFIVLAMIFIFVVVGFFEHTLWVVALLMVGVAIMVRQRWYILYDKYQKNI